VLRALLERGLIRILGKKQEPGRPLLYGTTKDFLAFFGLKNLSELPSLREFQELSEEQRKEAGIDDGDQQKLPDIDMGDVDQAAAGGENKPSFASLVEASRSKMGPSSDIDPDLEEALTDANEAARAARRVQKQIDQSENPEGEEEKKEGEADVDSDSSKTSGGPSSLDELARRKLRGSSTKEREGSSEPERDERDEQDERDESPAGGQSGQSEQPEPSTEKEAAEEPSAEEPEHEQLDQPEQSEPEEDAEEQPGEESEQEK
jgi:segregation and condensation protein B